MKRNPRPRKYASDAERQAAFRARNVMVEFRAENKTADTLNKIADEIDVSRSDLVLSMVKFALTNHDWARFGLTHKTIPLYKGNPMATKKPSPAQLAARQKFADMVRARAAAAKGKKMPRKNPSVSHAINNLRTVKQMREWFGIQTDGLTDGQVKALKSELIILGYGEYTAGQLPPKVFYNALNFATGRKTNPITETVIFGLPPNETRDYMEVLIYGGQGKLTQLQVDKVLKAASDAGYHSFRVTGLDMTKAPDFTKVLQTKKTVKKNPSEAPLHHLYGNKYFKIIKNNGLFEVVIVQKVNTGIGTEYDYYDGKTFKTLAGASRWINKHTPPKTNPINKYIVYSELSPQKYKQMLVTENKQRAIQTADINQMENYHSVVEDETGHLIYDAKTRKKYLTNPRKKTVNQKISQLEHEGYPHKQSIAIALSEQRKGKVKRNPSGEIGAYEITRNFKVLGIFKTKADAIKAAQGISDATGKTIAVKPVQVLAGHFDR